jgi:DNA processing protein
VRFDVRRCTTDQLAELLALDDAQLLEAVGLRAEDAPSVPDGEGVPDDDGVPDGARITGSDPLSGRASSGTEAIEICRHDPAYPHGPGGDTERWAPAVLHVAGPPERLAALSAGPAVAIVGTRRATDYGADLAWSWAAELAAAGLPVVAGFAEGIGAAALEGAAQSGGTAVSVMAGGVDVCSPSGRRTLHQALLAGGCALSEFSDGARPRRWSYAARNRIVTALASVVVVVEAESRPGDLMLARHAIGLGRPVAAVPGRVTSPASRGCHELLAEGARLVCAPADVLDLAYGVGGSATVARAAPSLPADALPAADRAVLSHVQRGAGTVDGLTCRGVDYGDAVLALTRLELAGLLRRGTDGRYLASAVNRPHAGGSPP